MISKYPYCGGVFKPHGLPGAAMYRKLIDACVGLAMMGMAGTANAVPIVQFVVNGVCGDGAVNPCTDLGLNAGDAVSATFSFAASVLDGSSNQIVFAAEFTEFQVDIGSLSFGFGDILAGNAVVIDSTGLLPVLTGSAGAVGQLVSGEFVAFFAGPAFSIGPGSTHGQVGLGAWQSSIVDAPEPSTLALFATGLALLAFLGWRRRPRQRTQAAA
jgi:hypothetical protein